MQTTDLIVASTSTDFAAAKTLFLEYAASLSFDLGFQGFSKEIAEIDKQYSPPHGLLLLCRDDKGRSLGCVGVRKLDDDIAELKRLYVKPEFRSLKIGRRLAIAAVDQAKTLGYRFIRLDSVPGQEAAQKLYRQLGFYLIGPYRHNPLPGTVYMEMDMNKDNLMEAVPTGPTTSDK